MVKINRGWVISLSDRDVNELISSYSVLSMDLPLTYQGKKGLQMVFDCASDEDEKIILRKVKDELKQLPELGGIFYNVTCG